MDILEGKTAYNNRPVRAEKPQGETFEYSDAGYCVLQQLLQEVMHQSFDGIVRDTLFHPLGLGSTFFAAPGKFLWQLFTEGIAMVFEQEIVGDPEYFHQDTGGWKAWCDRHAQRILESFRGDLENMTQESQRYFGDWARFEGHGDTGYYLGTRFVRSLLESNPFERLISWTPEDVQDAFERFDLTPRPSQ